MRCGVVINSRAHEIGQQAVGQFARPLEETNADLDAVSAEIMQLLQEVHS